MFNFFKKDIKKIKEKHEKELFDKRGVLAVGIGHKIKDGKDTKKDSIVVFVKTKMIEEALLNSEKVPKKIDGIETDVIEIGEEIRPLYRKKHRPVIGGTSGIVETGTACSIGLIAFKNGKPVALTNEHCVTFPSGTDNVGKLFLQPSPVDGGKTVDAIGKVSSKPTLRNDQINKVDSAIIELDENIKYDLSVKDIKNYPKKWIEPEVGMKFIKIGRTTGKTEGIISHTNVTAQVNYKGNLGVCSFYPCFFALQNNYNIVDGGDSGSCVFNSDGIIGQTFAAAPNLAIFLVGSIIGKELGIELDKAQLNQEGWIALGSWMEFNGFEIKVTGKTNFRSSPGLSDNIIKVLSKDSKLKVSDEEIVKADGYVWIRVLLK